LSFASLIFLFFAPVVFILYCMLPSRSRWILLLGASYTFYAYWDWRYLPLLFGSTFIDYFCAHRMAKYESKQHKRPWLWLSLVVNLGVLFGFKYWNFVGSNFNALLGVNIELHNLLLPLGVSFYTLQTLSYSFDIYLGKVKPENHFGYFCLFVCFFPQLVAGPIERSRSLLPQLKSLRLATIYEFRYGLMLIVWGFFLKLVVADNMTRFINSIYFNETVFAFWLYWLAGGLVIIKIYCDFMAYSEIARGLAMLFGVRLTINFQRPLLATSLRNYWKRWHISLTRWIVDYIHVPLVNKFSSDFTRFFVSIFSMCIVGFWHGASWNFFIFGLFNGVVLVLWRPIARFFQRKLDLSLSMRQWTGWAATVLVSSINGSMFYIIDTTTLHTVLSHMFDFNSSFTFVWPSGLHGKLQLLKAFIGFILLACYSLIAEYSGVELIDLLARRNSIYRWSSALVLLLLILLFGNFISEEFVYFKF